LAGLVNGYFKLATTTRVGFCLLPFLPLPACFFAARASAFKWRSCFTCIFLLKLSTLTVNTLLRMRRILLSVPGLRGFGVRFVILALAVAMAAVAVLVMVVFACALEQKSIVITVSAISICAFIVLCICVLFLRGVKLYPFSLQQRNCI